MTVRRRPGEPLDSYLKRIASEKSLDVVPDNTNPIQNPPTQEPVETSQTTPNETSGNKKPDKTAKEDVIFKSEYWQDGVRYEQVFDALKRKTEFVSYNTETGVSVRKPFIEAGKTKIYPIIDDFLMKNLIQLPQIPTSYLTVKELDADITSFITKWADISAEHLKVVPGYIRFTWIADKSNTSPYLRCIAPSEDYAGKLSSVEAPLHRQLSFV
jgi:hypothetical protein